MKRSDLKNFFLASTSGLKAGQIAAGLLENLIQLSADDVAFRTLCLPTNDVFDAEEDEGEYDLSTEVDQFVALHPAGLWFNEGTVADPEWKQLQAVTIKWLDEHRRNWRSATSDVPQYFYQEGNTLGAFPKPNADLTGGFWLYFYQGAFPMTTDDHYPFRGTAQITRLSILDRAMSLHFRWQAQGMLGKNDDYKLNENAYEKEITRVKGLLLRNAATLNDRHTKMGGPAIRSNFK